MAKESDTNKSNILMCFSTTILLSTGTVNTLLYNNHPMSNDDGIIVDGQLTSEMKLNQGYKDNIGNIEKEFTNLLEQKDTIIKVENLKYIAKIFKLCETKNYKIAITSYDKYPIADKLLLEKIGKEATIDVSKIHIICGFAKNSDNGKNEHIQKAAELYNMTSDESVVIYFDFNKHHLQTAKELSSGIIKPVTIPLNGDSADILRVLYYHILKEDSLYDRLTLQSESDLTGKELTRKQKMVDREDLDNYVYIHSDYHIDSSDDDEGSGLVVVGRDSIPEGINEWYT